MTMLADINMRLATVGDKPAGEPRACESGHRGEKKRLTDRPQGG